MLDWIKSGRSDHPLADAKTEREAFADLPADSFKLLGELSHWLDVLHGDDALKLPRLVEIVDRVDHAARGSLRKLQIDYLDGGGRLQQFQEQRIRTSAIDFWKRLADAHLLILQRYRSAAPGGGVKAGLPLVVARGMRALGMQLKWQLLHYGPVDSNVWAGLGKFLAYAEEQGFENSAITVYPGSVSSIQREFLKAAMLAISSTDSLLPRKLDVAERLVAHFDTHYILRRQPAKGCHFYVDIGNARMPARFVERIEIGPGIRFFGPGDAAEALTGFSQATHASGAVSSEVDLGGPQDAAMVCDVAFHLSRYWGAQPPARSGERRSSIEQIDVVHGYDEILARLRKDESQDLDFENGAETWKVENESDGGYGSFAAAGLQQMAQGRHPDRCQADRRRSLGHRYRAAYFRAGRQATLRGRAVSRAWHFGGADSFGQGLRRASACLAAPVALHRQSRSRRHEPFAEGGRFLARIFAGDACLRQDLSAGAARTDRRRT